MNAHPALGKQRWFDAGRAAEVPTRGARRVSTPLGDVAIFRTTDGELFALVDRCPHKGGPLSQGMVVGHAVACPLHNWQISLVTGEPLGADAGHGCAPPIPIEVREGRVMLGLGRR
jgi:nitrite reductase (NADH) small subunit